MPLDTAVCPRSDLPVVTGGKSGLADSASGPPVLTEVGTAVRGGGHMPGECLRSPSGTESTARVDRECHQLYHQQTRDAAATRQLAAATVLSPHGDPGWRKQDPGPRQPRFNQRNGSSEPRLLHLPVHRKLLNSLT